jgi:hypothetical protein
MKARDTDVWARLPSEKVRGDWSTFNGKGPMVENCKVLGRKCDEINSHYFSKHEFGEARKSTALRRDRRNFNMIGIGRNRMGTGLRKVRHLSCVLRDELRYAQVMMKMDPRNCNQLRKFH